MRLLRRSSTGEFSLEDIVDYNKIPPYAILSHTWGEDIDEVTFEDLKNNTGRDKAGYKKILFCGKQAAQDGLCYFWIDTCCIDKSSSAELSEAINSMYRWYQEAAICYVYLSDVSLDGFARNDLSFQKSRWFTRGWTLQELLAPPSVKFFSVEGKRLGDKISLIQEIHEITGISIRALQGSPPSRFSVDERMSWAANRETKREEDKIYSLLGLFDISMPSIYGEGLVKARARLQREIKQAPIDGPLVLPLAPAAEQPKRNCKPPLTEHIGRDSECLKDCDISAWIRESSPRHVQSSSADLRMREIQKGPTWREEVNFLRSLNASPYRARKDRNPDRVPGTCDWFVSHELFREWQESNSSRMLWVSADPGCGKSVLAKYLVDSFIPTTESRTVCYFFFKDDFDDQRNAASALCCILRQIFTHKPILLCDAILEQFTIDGEQFISSFSELWNTLVSVAEDKNAGEIICILDAIDECEGQGRSELVQKLCQLYSIRRNFNLKFLVTSRPYGQIRRGFQPLDISELPVIHLSGESEVEMRKISREIDVFIRARVQDIRARLKLTHDEEHLLLQELMRVPNRTYLWAHLTLDLVESDIDIDKTAILEATSQLPETVDEAYNRILSKSRDSEKARKILHIVVAAERPLTLKEMALALVLRESHWSHNDLDLRPEDRFRGDVRDICGLFVTVIDSKIYLLHQTAKEFLVQNDRVSPSKGTPRTFKWRHSLHPRESHLILARICIWYLLLDEFETHPPESGPSSQYKEDHILLDYSAKHWATHLRELQIAIQDIMTQSVLKLCDVKSRRYLTWFRIYWESINTDFPHRFTTLMLASYFGLGTIVKRLLKLEDVDLNARDDTYGRSALSWAAGNGSDVVVKLLIKSTSVRCRYLKLPFGIGPKIDSVDKYGRTPLSYAVWNGNLAVVKRLVKAGARADLEDEIGGSPLSYAVCHGQEVVKLLLKRGTNIDSEGDIMKQLLFSAANKGHEAVVELLLETGKIGLNSRDVNGRTPLSRAATCGHEAVVKLLLETGKVDVDSRDSYGLTPLSWAAGGGHEAVVKLLLGTGKVDVDSRDVNGRTPLSWAARQGYEAVVKLLLETGKIDVNLRDNYFGKTPLSWAADGGHEAVVKLLLGTGKVDVDSRDVNGKMPLSWAAGGGHEAVVKLLLGTGKVDVDSRDVNGRTPLSWAAGGGHEAAVKLLLETEKVDVNLRDNGRTPLSWAVRQGHEAVVKLLLETGKVDVNLRDNYFGKTPLSWAADGGHEAVVKLLLGTGKVYVDSRSDNGQTPLSWAACGGHEAVVKLLLETGKVDDDSRDNMRRTPLSWAARQGHEAVVKLLLETGKVDIDSRDSYGRTPLSRAATCGHDAIVGLMRLYDARS